MGDAVLVSFCNVSAPHLPLLGIYRPEAAELIALRLAGELTAGFKGVTGVAERDGYLYAVGQFRPREGEPATSRTALLVFNRDALDLLTIYEFRGASDGHSIAFSGGKLYLASSGTDQIVELEVKGAEVVAERPYLQAAQGHLADMNHLNGLCDSPDGLILSAFGLRTDQSWASATNGFILNVKRRERIRTGLQHPHSPFVLGQSIVFCQSRTTSVETVSCDRRQELPGYTRGICKCGEDFFVATSVGRKTSRSTGQVIENPGVAGVVAGGCTINRLKTGDFGLVSTYQAPLAIGEIYDLMTVGNVEQWPVDERPLRETSVLYFAIYARGSSAPFVIEDSTVGSAPLLVSDEAGAIRLAQSLGGFEVRRLAGRDAVLESIDVSNLYVAIDGRIDEAGQIQASRLMPVEQFKQNLLVG
jgi:hypothetical protein